MDYKVGEYDLKDIQNVMLQMMADIDRVCQKHGIHYILDGGSMLGAVRHKGFIPWDDDLDIAMLRDDYIRFTEVANQELQGKYQFQCAENTPEYPYSFGKVFCLGTTFTEHFTAKLNISHGVYIDVFPMDYVNVEKQKQLARRRKWTSKFTQARYAKLGLTPGFKGFVGRCMPMKLINWCCLKNMMYHYKKSDYVQKLCHFGKNKPPISASLFTDTVRVPFESCTFSIPKAYDSFLRGRYGDYMKLPPLEDQRPLHHITGVKL